MQETMRYFLHPEYNCRASYNYRLEHLFERPCGKWKTATWTNEIDSRTDPTKKKVRVYESRTLMGAFLFVIVFVLMYQMVAIGK